MGAAEQIPIPPLKTFDDYLAFERESEEKHEWFNGSIHAMSGGTYEHSVIKTNLIADLRQALLGKPCRPLDSDMRVKSPDGRSAYPDATVVCGDPELYDESRDVLLNPTVLFEVTSRSTRGIDQRGKFFSYSEMPALQEYVLIEQAKPAVMVYRRTSSDEEWTLKLTQGLESAVSLQSLGIELSLKSIYDGVTFDSDKNSDDQSHTESASSDSLEQQP